MLEGAEESDRRAVSIERSRQQRLTDLTTWVASAIAAIAEVESDRCEVRHCAVWPCVYGAPISRSVTLTTSVILNGLRIKAV